MRLTHVVFFRVKLQNVKTFLTKLYKKFFGSFTVLENYILGTTKCFSILFYHKISRT